MASRASRLESLLQSVLTMPSEQRSAFIREACAGDPELEEEVQQRVLRYERASIIEERAAEFSVAPGLPIGTVLDDKYEIIARLGLGGMGEVFKARHIHLDTIRCVKVMRKALTADESLRSRFVREGMAATRLHHPNVATVHDVSKMADGSYYLVTEFIDGQTLRQWIREHGRLSLPFAVEVALQVLSGLQHCHDRGLLHRDISSDNVMISTDASGAAIVKIIDLGIAKVISGPRSDTTREGLFVGNPRYSSPEQLGLLPDKGEIDARADLYCLGVVLYEMVAGTPPFVSTTPQGYAAKHLTQPVPPFSASDPHLRIPDGFEAVVIKALEKDRRHRYHSAREFAEAIKPYAGSLPLTTWVTMPSSTPLPEEVIAPDRNAPTQPIRDRELVPIDSQPTVVVEPKHRPLLFRIAAVSVAVLAVALIVILVWQQSRAIPASKPARSVVFTSFLAVDALPWGEVNAILDHTGRNVLPTGGVRYTPLTLALPPGHYRVSITNPKRSTPLLINADIPKSGTAALQANFGPSEAADYFAKVPR